MQKVEGIIIDPDSDRRTRLRQACFAVAELAKLDATGNFQQGLARLCERGEIDVTAVFISARFTRDVIRSFVTEAKKTFRGVDSAYILVIESKDQDGKGLVGSLMDGIDGILIEPFSVESLTETARLAMVIKNQRKEAREEAVVRLTIIDALAHLDLVAEKLVRQQEGGPELKYFRALPEIFKAFNQRSQALYLQLLPGELESAKPPLLTIQQEQNGSSSDKRRAYLKAIQRLKAKGFDVSDAEAPAENQDADHSNLWEETSSKTNIFSLKLKLDLYDKPTSETLLSHITQQELNAGDTVELDLSNTKTISSYALQHLIVCQNSILSKKALFHIKSPQHFVHEAFTILRLGEIFRVID